MRVFIMETLLRVLSKAKPFLAMFFIQFLYALMSMFVKSALNKGMSPRVLVAYRMAVAAALFSPFALIFERNERPRMTLGIFIRISILSMFEPVVDQNLFYTGMKLTTATFASAICNVLPAITFMMALIFRYEKVGVRNVRSIAKVVGTTLAVGGTMIMTFVKGNVIELPWTEGTSNLRRYVQPNLGAVGEKHTVIGASLLIGGCFSWSCFVILQAKILKAYPAQLTLTALMCFMGFVEGSVLTLVIDGVKTAVWSIRFDLNLLAATYGGAVSGFAYYIIGWVSKDRGLVFVSAFSPLNMIIITILSSFIFSEDLYLGRVIGALVIVLGIYMVLWGKSKHQAQNPSTSQDDVKEINQETETQASIDSIEVIPIS